MLHIPQLSHDLGPSAQAHAYVRVANSWSAWTCGDVRYAWADGRLLATDADGRVWHYDPFRSAWFRHVASKAAVA